MGRVAPVIGVMVAAMIALACATPTATPRTTVAAGQRMKRPAIWLTKALAERIQLLKPDAFVEVVQVGEVRLRLSPRQEPVRVYAARAADPCAIGDEFCDEAIERLARKAIEVAEHESVPIKRDRIVPRVDNAAFIGRVNEAVTEESLIAVERAFVGELRVVYGYLDDYSPRRDRARRGGLVIVRRRDLVRRLNLDPQQLHDLAVRNLSRARHEFRLEPIVGTPGVWRLERAPREFEYADGSGKKYPFPGDVVAGLTLDSLWEEAARTIKGELAVLVLRREIIVATTAERRAIAYLVEQSKSQSGFTADPTLLVWRNGWQVFLP